jgi:hypothetical protein
MALLTGRKLAPYRISAALWRGWDGRGVSRRGQAAGSRSGDQDFAGASFPMGKQRFEPEAKTISRLNHPHICVLHDVGTQDGISYLVMECVETRDAGEAAGFRLQNKSFATTVWHTVSIESGLKLFEEKTG